LEGLHEPYRSEALKLIRENTQYVDAFIAVSDYYADFMAGYLDIPRNKIHTVPLGINLNDYPQLGTGHNNHSDVFRIGYFARVAPEKGLHVLSEAYIALRKREGFGPACLEAAGYLAPEHKPYLQKIEQEMREAGLADEFRYHGALDRDAKLRFLQNIDVLSIPTTYDEAKGLPVLEAMASGVPVVQPRRGSFTEMVERTRGGVLYDSNDAAKLAEEIYALWKNPELRNDLARQGSAGVRDNYSVALMAENVLGVYSLLNLVDSPMPRSDSSIEFA
jgi:glycosyltransferase involved in cell wall biosynthesis